MRSTLHWTVVRTTQHIFIFKGNNCDVFNVSHGLLPDLATSPASKPVASVIWDRPFLEVPYVESSYWSLGATFAGLVFLMSPCVKTHAASLSPNVVGVGPSPPGPLTSLPLVLYWLTIPLPASLRVTSLPGLICCTFVLLSL